MRRQLTPFEEVQMISKLADLKEEQYTYNLMVSALTELLIKKGIITAEELRERTALLDLCGTLEALSGHKH